MYKRIKAIGGIPKPLNIKGRPALNKFPASVLFMDIILENGIYYYRWTTYNPLLETYSKQKGVESMTYQNKYQKDWHLKITYQKSTRRYEARKYHGRKLLIYGFGTTWRSFFFNLTRRGLEDGEE